MKKSFTFNEFGICTSPDVIFKRVSSYATIKVMMARHQGLWIAGYQISIYVDSLGGVSNLIYPRLDRLTYSTQSEAIAAAIKCIHNVILRSFTIDAHLEYIHLLKSFQKIKSLEILT